jgi:Rieske Fe-S protein
MNVGRNVSRRTFLVWYMAGLITAITAAVVAPILIYTWPPPPPGTKFADIKVKTKKPLSQVQDGEAIEVDSPPDGAFVMADGGGDNAKGDIAYRAWYVKNAGKEHLFAVNCSHLGCSVAFNAAGKTFDCPCHGSMFNLDGTVKHPPAAFPLSNLTWKATGPDELTIQGLITGGA